MIVSAQVVGTKLAVTAISRKLTTTKLNAMDIAKKAAIYGTAVLKNSTPRSNKVRKGRSKPLADGWNKRLLPGQGYDIYHEAKTKRNIIRYLDEGTKAHTVRPRRKKAMAFYSEGRGTTKYKLKHGNNVITRKPIRVSRKLGLHFINKAKIAVNAFIRSEIQRLKSGAK